MNKPTHVMVLEPIDCTACGGSGYAPGHEPTEPGVPYRWCSTCQGQRSRMRAMLLEDFAKLFETRSCMDPFPGILRPAKEE